MPPDGYAEWLTELKARIHGAQQRAALAVNRELVHLYWQIGRDILSRQAEQGWGSKVVARLSEDLRSAFPDMKGFSPRNLKYMRAFAEAWPDGQFVQEVLAQLPWYHQVALLDKLPGPETRKWYAAQALEHNWSRNVLVMQIESRLLERSGKAVTNFPVTVHDINELTVVTDESYTAFVKALQEEIAESLSDRPRKASIDYFVDKQITLADGSTSILEKTVAQALYNHLIRHDYIDDDGLVTQAYKDARAAGTLAVSSAEALKPIIDFVWPLVDALYLDVPTPTDGRKPKKIPLNEANFKKREFQELWGRINHKAIYQVEFDSGELIGKCIRVLDTSLSVTVMQYVVEKGVQLETIETDQLQAGEGFTVISTKVEQSVLSAGSTVKYDLLGEIAEKTRLTRRTCAAILTGVNPGTFAKFKQNPEQFITEASRLINEQKATVIVEHLAYDPIEDRHDSSIFTENQTAQDLSKAGDKLKKSVYEYVVTGSNVERSFVKDLDTSDEVVVYSKLPRGFFIPTPVGDYNPDWAIAFRDGRVKHVYFVAETKGSMSTLQLKGVEEAKIECARKFFASLNDKAENNGVKYDVVGSYDSLLQIVGT